MSQNDPRSFGRSVESLAAFVCFFGCFVYAVLSEPLLDALGLPYTGTEGLSLFKIHPGALVVFASAILLGIAGIKDPQRLKTLKLQEAPAIILWISVVVITAYAWMRSGGHGLAFLIDTHMVVPLIALGTAAAAPCLARRMAFVFIGFAALDAAGAVAEYVTHHRIYNFDPTWPLLHEAQFRATSLMGSPLASELFLPVVLFTALSLPLPPLLKGGLSMLLLAGLMASGGYGGIVIVCVGFVLLAGRFLRSHPEKKKDVTMQARASVIGVLLFLCLMGVQLATHADDQAVLTTEFTHIKESQLKVMAVIGQMDMRDVFLGASADRITALGAGAGFDMLHSDIDSPWLLLFMTMGGIFFLLWFLSSGMFFRRLLKGQDLALLLAVGAYFAIASISNSFGRKDVIYPATIGLICAALKRHESAVEKAYDYSRQT